MKIEIEKDFELRIVNNYHEKLSKEKKLSLSRSQTLPLGIKVQSFGEGENKSALICANRKWRMFNCYDCTSEFGYERKLRINENFFLEEQGFYLTKDVERRAR